MAIFSISGSEVLKSSNMVIIFGGYDYQCQGLLEERDCSSTMKTVTYQKQKEITISVEESHKAQWRISGGVKEAVDHVICIYLVRQF